MNIKPTSLATFLMALSVINTTSISSMEEPNTIEDRLARLTKAVQDRESQLQETIPPELLASIQRWLNGGQWRDGNNFANWRNRWNDFSGFVDFRDL